MEQKSIRSKIKELNIETSAYLGLYISDKEITIAVKTPKSTKIIAKKYHEDYESFIVEWVRDYAIKNNLKFIAAGLTGKDKLKQLGSRLWLEEDVVPYVFEKVKGKTIQDKVKNIVKEVRNNFDDNDLVKVTVSDENEVNVSELVTLEDYERTVKYEEFSRLLSYAEKFKGKKISFFNSTAQGGGVALMRHAMIRLYKLLGVDAHWYNMEPKKEVFDITKKKFHNVLHGISDLNLNDNDKKIFEEWTKENAKKFKKVFKESDVIVIDDPQPSGLIKYIRKVNPYAKIIFRSHIQLETYLMRRKGTPQNKTWNFISENIKHSDVFVSHPIKQFIPHNIIKKKTVLMPAVTDPLDGLNKELKDRYILYNLKLFNKYLLESGQDVLDLNRPYIIQIARFDPSKGIPDVIESYRILCKILEKKNLERPQLVLVGHGAVDDPEGAPLYLNTLDIIKSDKYKHLKKDIKVARLPHNDQILNSLLRRAHIALQLSHKEGFEVKVTEALHKGKPVIAYKVGGIPLQIKHKVTGYLVKKGDQKKVAHYMYDLITDKNLYNKMSLRARHVNTDYFTVSNCINWLFLANTLLENGEVQGEGRYIKDIIKNYESKSFLSDFLKSIKHKSGYSHETIIVNPKSGAFSFFRMKRD